MRFPTCRNPALRWPITLAFVLLLGIFLVSCWYSFTLLRFSSPFLFVHECLRVERGAAEWKLGPDPAAESSMGDISGPARYEWHVHIWSSRSSPPSASSTWSMFLLPRIHKHEVPQGLTPTGVSLPALSPYYIIAIPFWIPLSLLACLTWRSWKSHLLHRRVIQNTRCLRCRYSRAGLGAESPCPECGSAFASRLN